MDDSEQLDNDMETSLKGKEFDEACALAADDESARVFVNRKPEGSGRWEFCFSGPLREYDEAALLDNIFMDYGPGEYPVQIRSQSETGSRIRWQKNFRVAARRRPPSSPQPAAAPAANNDALALAIENQSRMLGALLEKITQPAPQQSRQDIMSELASMKDLFVTDQKDPLEGFKTFFEMQKMMTEAAGGDTDPLTKALNMFGPKIIEELDKEKAQPQRAGVPARASEPPATTATPEPKFAHIDVDSAFAIFAENYMSQLMKLPHETAPEDLGKYIARMVGDNPQLLHIVGLVIADDQMVERLAQFDASVLQRAEWLDGIADWLAHALWPDTNPAPTPENATINATLDDFRDSQVITPSNSDGTDGANPEDDDHDELTLVDDDSGASTSTG